MRCNTLDNIWRSFSGRGPFQEMGDYLVEPLLSREGIRLYAAVVRNSLMPALVLDVPAPLWPGPICDRATPNFTWRSETLLGVPIDRRTLVLQLRQPRDGGVFRHLAAAVWNAVASGQSGQSAVRAVQDTIDRWRAFLSPVPGGLSDAHVRELIAKLAVVGRLVSRVGPVTVVGACARAFSPGGLIECRDSTIRVVATLPEADTRVSFEDAAVPASYEDVPLILACQELIPSDDESLSLPGHVGHARAAMSRDRLCDRALLGLLTASGYSSLFSVLYREPYALGALTVYRLPRGFARVPHWCRPQHASRVHWEVPVAALAPYRADADTEVGPPRPVLEIPL